MPPYKSKKPTRRFAKTDNAVRTSTVFSRSEHEKLWALARETDRTVARLLRDIVRERFQMRPLD